MKETKVCTNCGTKRSVEEFQENSRYKDGRSTWCKSCHKTASTKSRKICAERDPDYHKNNALRKHDMNVEQYLEKLSEQGGHCALCSATTSKGERLSVDHDHNICPGKYACNKCRRGLLCSSCNARLGYLEQTMRDIGIWQSFREIVCHGTWTALALQYLKRYSTQEDSACLVKP